MFGKKVKTAKLDLKNRPGYLPCYGTAFSSTFQVSCSSVFGLYADEEVSSFAEDSLQSLVAIGTVKGDVLMFGHPMIRSRITPPAGCEGVVTDLCFLVPFGALAVLYSNRCIAVFSIAGAGASTIRVTRLSGDGPGPCLLYHFKNARCLFVGYRDGNVGVFNLQEYFVSDYLLSLSAMLALPFTAEDPSPLFAKDVRYLCVSPSDESLLFAQVGSFGLCSIDLMTKSVVHMETPPKDFRLVSAHVYFESSPIIVCVFIHPTSNGLCALRIYSVSEKDCKQWDVLYEAFDCSLLSPLDGRILSACISDDLTLLVKNCSRQVYVAKFSSGFKTLSSVNISGSLSYWKGFGSFSSVPSWRIPEFNPFVYNGGMVNASTETVLWTAPFHLPYCDSLSERLSFMYGSEWPFFGGTPVRTPQSKNSSSFFTTKYALVPLCVCLSKGGLVQAWAAGRFLLDACSLAFDVQQEYVAADFALVCHVSSPFVVVTHQGKPIVQFHRFEFRFSAPNTNVLPIELVSKDRPDSATASPTSVSWTMELPDVCQYQHSLLEQVQRNFPKKNFVVASPVFCGPDGAQCFICGTAKGKFTLYMVSGTFPSVELISRAKYQTDASLPVAVFPASETGIPSTKSVLLCAPFRRLQNSVLLDGVDESSGCFSVSRGCVELWVCASCAVNPGFILQMNNVAVNGSRSPPRPKPGKCMLRVRFFQSSSSKAVECLSEALDSWEAIDGLTFSVPCEHSDVFSMSFTTTSLWSTGDAACAVLVIPPSQDAAQEIRNGVFQFPYVFDYVCSPMSHAVVAQTSCVSFMDFRDAWNWYPTQGSPKKPKRKYGTSLWTLPVVCNVRCIPLDVAVFDLQSQRWCKTPLFVVVTADHTVLLVDPFFVSNYVSVELGDRVPDGYRIHDVSVSEATGSLLLILVPSGSADSSRVLLMTVDFLSSVSLKENAQSLGFEFSLSDELDQKRVVFPIFYAADPVSFFQPIETGSQEASEPKPVASGIAKLKKVLSAFKVPSGKPAQPVLSQSIVDNALFVLLCTADAAKHSKSNAPSFGVASASNDQGAATSAAQARDMLKMRGEKLNQMADNSSRMEANAEEFLRSIREHNEREAKKKWWQV
eukprot:ANDGO_03460.mRNA.1 hypothetical protein